MPYDNALVRDRIRNSCTCIEYGSFDVPPSRGTVATDAVPNICGHARAFAGIRRTARTRLAAVDFYCARGTFNEGDARARRSVRGVFNIIIIIIMIRALRIAV